MLAIIAALSFLLVPAAPPARAWTASPEVVLNDTIRGKLDAVAARVFKASRHRLHVTSGVRTPRSQARAMYNKLRAGGSLGIYMRQDLVKPIHAAWREGRRKKWKADRTVEAMAAVLARQVAAGHYLSRHLSGRGFDLRSVGMPRKARSALYRAVREVGGLSIIEERRPPHFHLEISANHDDTPSERAESPETPSEKPPDTAEPPVKND